MPRAPQEPTKYEGVWKRKIGTGPSKKGRWVYDYLYRDTSGKQRWVKGKHTEIEGARKARLEALHAVAHGHPTDGRSTTLRDFAEKSWLPTQRSRSAESKLRASTVRQYERDVNNHLLKALGSRFLAQIRIQDVETLRDDLLAAGKSADTTRRIINTLGYILRYARARRVINYNPVEDVEKPSPRRRTPTLPTLEQLYKLADATERWDRKNLILLAAFTGARKSELFALAWRNVDLTEGDERIRIVEQFYKGEFVPHAKTAAGDREIVLGPEAAAVLREQAAGQEVDNRPNPRSLVFPAPEGGYWLDSNFTRRVWVPARTAAGLPDLMFHTLRYFYNSHIRALGLPAALTEQIVGHTDERTHRGYTVPIAGTEKLIRDAQDGIFARPTEKNA